MPEETKIPEVIKSFLEKFDTPYQEPNLIFAYYASFAGIFSPDYLYQLWYFFKDYKKNAEAQKLHRVVVADLLSSFICEEVAFELFEMDESFASKLQHYFPHYCQSNHIGLLYTQKDFASLTLEYAERYYKYGNRQNLFNMLYWKSKFILDPAEANHELKNILTQQNKANFAGQNASIMLELVKIQPEHKAQQGTKQDISRVPTFTMEDISLEEDQDRIRINDINLANIIAQKLGLSPEPPQEELLSDFSKLSTNQLIKVFARLYPFPDHTRRVIAMIGLDSLNVNFQKAAIEFWVDILQYVEEQDQLENLIRFVWTDNNRDTISELINEAKSNPDQSYPPQTSSIQKFSDRVKQIHRILAELYPTVEGSVRIVELSGLQVEHINLGSGQSANMIWFNIIQHALDKNRLEVLIEVVLNEYPNREDLKNLLTIELDSEPKSSISYKISEELQEKINQIIPLCAMLYPESGSAMRVVAMAGIDELNINFYGSAIEVWTNIIKQVTDEGLLVNLLVFILEEYPNQEKIKELLLDLQSNYFIQLIEENLKTQALTLDLGKCGLDGTEPALELLVKCDHLQTLIFSNEWQEYAFQTEQWIKKASINQGEPNILQLIPETLPPNLQSLILAGDWQDSWKISDLSPLTHLENLQDLNLRFLKIDDLTPLNTLHSLRVLNLEGNQVQDISALDALKDLTTLHLWRNQIHNISPLANLTSLQVLLLYQNQIKDISPLAELKGVKELSLGNNQIEDISPLNQLTELTKLDLRKNSFSEISLHGLEKLKEIQLNGNTINYLSFSELNTIEELELVNLKLEKVNLVGLSQLKKLNLMSNNLQDISFLNELNHIESLDLSFNQLTHFPEDFLDRFTHLSFLKLEGNSIENIPKEIYNKDENVFEEVRQYFNQEKSDKRPKLSISQPAEYADKLRDLIAEARTKEAIKILISIAEGRNYYNDVILQSGKLNHLTEQFSYGSIEYDRYYVELNQINMTLLEIIDELAKEQVKNDISISGSDKGGIIYPDFKELGRVIGKGELFNVNWLQKATNASNSVCKVMLPSGKSGTGFILKGGYLMTTQHLLSSRELAEQAKIVFNFQQNLDGEMHQTQEFSLDVAFYITSPVGESTFDYALVKINDENNLLEKQGHLEVEIFREIQIDNQVNIIQHPEGNPMQIALPNRVISVWNQYLFYLVDTRPGSSGSPVFNQDWKVVAVHQAARTEDYNGDPGGFVINDSGDIRPSKRGILIKKILEDLKAKGYSDLVDQFIG